MPVAIRMKRYAAPVAGSCLLLYTPIERNEREAADLSRVWEPPPRCRDARKYDWAAGPGDRGALRDRHIVG